MRTSILRLQQALLGAAQAAGVRAEQLVGCVRAARNAAQHARGHAQLIPAPICRHVP